MSVALIWAIFCTLLAMCTAPEASATEVEQIYQSLAGPAVLFSDGRNAAFYRDGHRWTIVGAGQAPADLPVMAQATWRGGAIEPEFRLVHDPIHDDAILPFEDPPTNTFEGSVLRVRAARGETESASFVIRTGSDSLENTTISVDPPRRTDSTGTLPTVDVRVVKTWYQAGVRVARRASDSKTLTPELLVHDADLVRADHRHQVNLIRDYPSIQDATTLQSFSVPPRSNQQIWIDVDVPSTAAAGQYRGTLTVGYESAGVAQIHLLTLEIDVLPIDLGPTPIPHTLFYAGWTDRPYDFPLDTATRTTDEVRADLLLMARTGLTPPVFLHDYRSDALGINHGRPLEPLLRELVAVGYGMHFLYWDRHLTAADDATTYRRKLEYIRAATRRASIAELVVYNLDEQPIDRLLSGRHTFEIAHAIGARNMATISPEYASALSDLVDIALVHRSRTPENAPGVRVWAYNNPQAGEESPQTYRDRYGFALWLDGFDGACNFAYQTGHRPWDDWDIERWRPHNMTYPTVGGVIPTLQWAGWREAIDDLRYLAALLHSEFRISDITTVSDRRKQLELLIGEIPATGADLRHRVIERLLRARGPA